MKNKLFIIIGVLVVLGAGFYFYSQKNPAQAPTLDSNSQTSGDAMEKKDDSTVDAMEKKDSTTPPTNNNGGTFSGEEGIEGADVQVFEVSYNGSSFSPSSLKIKAGDIVTFKNTSNDELWVASNPHPVHTDYPEFNSKNLIPTGQTFDFKFIKVGTWGYHNHRNTSVTGTIIVTK